MAIRFDCVCGRSLKAHESYAGSRASCPTCGQFVQIPESVAEPVTTAGDESARRPASRSESMEIEEFLDPPAAPIETPNKERPPVLRRMFEALLDPRCIQWMLMLGGGLLVLGLIVLLINLLDIEAPYVIAGSMGAGTLALLGGGWYLTLKTKYQTAGRALTFLACVIAPLNLWYYHAQELFTLQDHLWVGGVVCSLLYIATVRVLRDPLFLYAVEAGVTLTVLLFLPVVHVSVDATAISIALIVLGAISIHAERAFPADTGEFPRARYGLPLFWCGQAQVGAALLVLLGSQIFSWLNEPIGKLVGFGFQGNLLTDKPLLAGGLWIVGTYLFLYSDLVVRRVGVYVYVAAFSLLMAIVTLVGWQFDSPEPVIIALAIVALAANLARSYVAETGDNLSRAASPLGIVLSGIPLLIGWAVHIRANSALLGPPVPIEWIYVVAMLIVAAGNRVSAHLCGAAHIRQAAIYLFFTAAGLLLAAAGLLPLIGLTEWSQQAPLLMLIPIGYVVASRLWRGRSPERPLVWIAHAATGVILFHVLLASLREFGAAIRPVQGEMQNLLLGLVFAEAAVMYSLAGLFRKRGANAYFAAAAACGAMWQWLGYFDVAGYYHTMLFAVLGVAALAAARSLGLEELTVYRNEGLYRRHGEKALALRGPGLTAFQSGNAILSIALLSVFWQGLMRLVAGESLWIENSTLLLTTAISVAAIYLVPNGSWRRLYMVASILMAGLAFLTIAIPWLQTLSPGERIELVCVLAGAALLIAGYVGRFRETGEPANEMVGVGLFLGSFLATVPLLVAVIYNRWWIDAISFRDELGILAVTIVMLVTGYAWQTRSPTLIGGGCLALYLIVMLAELAIRAEEMMGVAVFMTIVGGVVFAIGVALSMYREKLLELPDKIAKREGVFRIMNWR